jgi:replicative DNA helicase
MNPEARLPPHSIEAEQAVLGGLMLRGSALAEIADWIGEEDFYRRDHRAIYRAITQLAREGKPFDAVTLGEWFHAQNLADLVGGTSYVIELANSTPSAANIVAYADIVREKSALRREIDVATKVISAAFDPGAKTSELIAHEAAHALMQLAGNSRLAGPQSAKAAVRTWFECLHERYEAREEITGVLTPWRVVNDCVLGWQPKNLTVIAGRPGMGKTILGWQAAYFNALRGKRTLVFSLEMSTDELIQRAVSGIGQIPHDSLRRPACMAEEDWPKVTYGLTAISEAALDIDDQPSLTAEQIIARARREHLKKPLTMILIDHLHEIKRAGRDTVNELGDAARAFKALSKELGIPVLLNAQLNRVNTTRTDRRPTLADLRASGAIEEIADIVLLVHREDYYDAKHYMRGVIELIVAKGRNLRSGETLYLANRYDEMRAVDWEGSLPKPPALDDEDGDTVKRTRRKKSISDYAAARAGE